MTTTVEGTFNTAGLKLDPNSYPGDVVRKPRPPMSRPSPQTALRQAKSVTPSNAVVLAETPNQAVSVRTINPLVS